MSEQTVRLYKCCVRTLHRLQISLTERRSYVVYELWEECFELMFSNNLFLQLVHFIQKQYHRFAGKPPVKCRGLYTSSALRHRNLITHLEFHNRVKTCRDSASRLETPSSSSTSTRTSYPLIGTTKIIAEMLLKHCNHFPRWSRCPATSNMLQARR